MAFSKAQLRKSFLHFAIGKSFSLLMGLGILLLLVRVLPRDEYGIYVVLLSIFEVVQMATNGGAFSCAYRYVPELYAGRRGQALYLFVRIIVRYRILTLALGALLLWGLSPWMAARFDVQAHAAVIAMYALVLVLEGTGRFIDIVFESLLKQGCTQASIIARNMPKFLVLVALVSQAGSGQLDLHAWITVEILSAGFGVVFSLILLGVVCGRIQDEHPGDGAELDFKKISRYSGLGYLTQLFYAVLSADTARILFGKFSGVATVGAFGFAGSLVSMVRRYSPLFLLIGMIRPIFVAASVDARRDRDIPAYADMILRLNLFVLAPVLVVLILTGKDIALILSGGGFPEAGKYLVFFMVLLLAQTWRAIIELVANAYEDSTSPFLASWVSLAVMGGSVVAAVFLGADAICAGLLLSEVMWCLVTISLLGKKGFRAQYNIGSFGRIAVVMVFAVLIGEAVKVSAQFFHVGAMVQLFIVCAVIGIGYIGACSAWKIFDERERGLINSFLPRRVFIW